MAGARGHTSVPVTAQTSEWEDILIKKGIVEKDDVLRGKGLDPDQLRQEAAEKKAQEAEIEGLKSITLEDQLAEATLEELDEAEDDFLDDEDESIMQEYRAKRLAELKEVAAKGVFGSVYEISKADWLVDVNEASKSAWVVVHLYQDSVVECGVMARAMDILANRFRAVKFVKIRSTSAIENWPERNCPALFIYHGGEMCTQLIRCDSLGGKSMTAEDLEWYLSKQGVLETELEDDPSLQRSVVQISRGGRELTEDD